MRSETKRILRVWSVVLVGLLVALPGFPADEEKAEAKPAPKQARKAEAQPAPAPPPESPIWRAARESSGADDAEVTVITNEDLERMMAGLTPEQRMQGVYQAQRHIGDPEKPETADASAPGGAPAGEEALEWMDERRQAQSERDAATAEAEARVAAASARVAELERRLLANKNPLLSRRNYEREDKDVENWDDLPTPEKVAATEQELEAARKELDAARADLRRVRSAPAGTRSPRGEQGGGDASSKPD